MADLPCINVRPLAELLDRVPGWREMAPADAIAAIGKAEAEADDIFAQYAETIVRDDIQPK